jgi:uncharacterized protein YndB with AHSA1/START domain
MAANDTFRVERSALVDASPEVLFAAVNDFRRWTDWSPYETMDAQLEKTYSGPDHGEGAVYAWVGKKAGSGRMEIVTSEPSSRIVIQLDFSKPFVAHNTAEFSFEKQGTRTRVTWAMYGPVTLMSKVMGLFFSMDKLVGPQFEEGLANLRTVAEAARQPA